MLAQITRDVAALPDGYVRQLAPIMAEARRELATDLSRWLKNAPNGDERFTAQRLREAMLQLDTALRVVRQKLPGEMLGLLGEQGDAAAALALSNLKKQVVAHAKLFGGEARALPLRTASMVERGAALLMPRYRSTLERYGAEGVGAIQRQLSIGVLRGETFDELTRRLVKNSGAVLKAGWGHEEVAQRIAGGFTRSLQARAERIVRTECINSYNALTDSAIDDLEADDPGWVKKWDSSADKRACHVCRALDGKMIAPKGAVALYDLGNDRRTADEKQAQATANSIRADEEGDDWEDAAKGQSQAWRDARVAESPEQFGAVAKTQDMAGAYKRHLFERYQAADEALATGAVKAPETPELLKYRGAMEKAAREVGSAVTDMDRLQREVFEDVRALSAFSTGLEVEGVEGLDEEPLSDFTEAAGASLQNARALARASKGERLKKADLEIGSDTADLYGEIEEPSTEDMTKQEMAEAYAQRVAALQEKLPRLAEAQKRARTAMADAQKLDAAKAAESIAVDPDDEEGDGGVLATMTGKPRPDSDDEDFEVTYDDGSAGVDEEAYDAAVEQWRKDVDPAIVIAERTSAEVEALREQFDFDEAIDSVKDAEKATKKLAKDAGKLSATPVAVDEESEDDLGPSRLVGPGSRHDRARAWQAARAKRKAK